MKIEIKLLGIFLAVGFLGIVSTGAQAISQDRADKIEDRKAAIEDKKTEKLCDRLAKVGTRLVARLGGDEGQLKEREQNRVQEMEENRINRDAELESRRTERDQTREEFYNELMLKAGDDAAKKAAVEEFTASVEEAIKVRRAAIDQARKNMNVGIDQAIDAREANMQTLRNELKNNIEAAVDKTENACSDSATSEELKTMLDKLKADIKGIQVAHKAKVQEVKKVQTTLQALRETRKVAVETAIDNFKLTMKSAQEKLRIAMSGE